jgi:hypothetical protein
MAEATLQEALVAEMLGDIGKLHDAVRLLTEAVNREGENILVTINKLEAAGEQYNQAVLAANLKSKNDMLCYVEAMTNINMAKTAEEQRELVQKLIREAVSKEIIALKKVLSDSSINHQESFITRWGKILICCFFTALFGSVITIELIKGLIIF